MKQLAQILILALCSLFVVFLSSCTDIKKTKFTVDNRDKILSHLAPEERDLLMASLVRQTMANAFSRSSMPMTDRTVGDLIEDQRKWLTQQKAEEDRQKRLAEEMAAKETALRNMMTVALYRFEEKQALMSNYAQVDYAFENRSSKDVRAFQGRVVYRDVLGNELANTDLKVLTPIKSGQKSSTTDKLWFMAYSGLQGKTLDDVKIEWNPTKILFVDGTSETIPSK